MLKKVLSFSLLLCMVLLSYVGIAYSVDSESSGNNQLSRLDDYIEALSNNAWTMSAFLVGTDDSGLGLIADKNKTIRLPNNEIRLFENANGQVFITFILDGFTFKEMAIAEIMFDRDMTSFILYSGNCALLYGIVK